MEWVLNWIADGVVVTLLVGVGLRLASRVNASTRCWIWWATLLGVIGLAAAPWLVAASMDALRLGTPPATMGDKARLLRLSINVPALPPSLVRAVILTWCLVAAAEIIRLFLALAAVHTLKRSARPLDESFERRLTLWQSLRERGRAVRVAWSERVGVPSVLGLGSVVILLPEYLMTDVTEQELDQIIVHEYAHAQRYDDWTGFAQCLIRTFLGFHPAVRWIDRELTLEREVACDDWVVALTGSRRGYARLLTRLVERSRRSFDLRLVPGIARSRPTISTRVTRLLDFTRSRNTGVSVGGMIAASAVFFAAVGIAALVPFSFVVTRPASPLDAWAPSYQPASPPALVATGVAAAPLRPLDPPRRATGSLNSTAVEQLPPVEATVAEAEPSGRPPLSATALGTTMLFGAGSPEPESNPLASRDASGRAPWAGAATAGVAVAGSARRAGAAAAGYFSRVGSSISSKF